MLEEGAYEKLSKWIITQFPTSATPNVMANMSVRLLRRFSSSLLSAEYPSAADASPKLRTFCRKVELSLDILQVLEEDVKSALTKGKISSTSRRRGKTVINSCRVNPLPFHSMGITVPTTDMEARDVYVGVLSQLKSILEVCGFVAGNLCVELNVYSTSSSFSGSRCYRRFSNPPTRNECLPQQWKTWPRGQTNPGTRYLLWPNR